MDILRALKVEEQKQQESKEESLTDVFRNAQGFNPGDQIEGREDAETQNNNTQQNNISSNENNVPSQIQSKSAQPSQMSQPLEQQNISEQRQQQPAVENSQQNADGEQHQAQENQSANNSIT